MTAILGLNYTLIMRINTYEESIEYIRSLSSRGSILGLERMYRLCEILGNPQDRLKFIHVAGTNGKGSTSSYIASVLRASGYKCGMYSSPSLTDERDHFRINGEVISKEDYLQCVRRIEDVLSLKEGDLCPTQFEVETALAFCYFEMKKCDIVVLECGMGGRDDATNVIKTGVLNVFTSISLDHANILGNTVKEIATVKSGIVTADYVPIVMFDSGDDVYNVISAVAQSHNSKLYLAKPCGISNGTYRFIGEASERSGEFVLEFDYKEYKSIRSRMLGEFQKYNIITAIECVKALRDIGFLISELNLFAGIFNTLWPYRFEKISDNPVIILDGAHNPDAAMELKKTVNELYNGRKLTFVIGVFADKDYEKICEIMCPLAKKVIVTKTYGNKRALDEVTLSGVVGKYVNDVSVCDDIKDAAKEAVKSDGDVILAFGSLSYLNDIKEAFMNIVECK